MTEIDLVRREIIQLNLTIKELIQKVQNCTGPIEELNELNHEGRKKISLLRNNLAMLTTLAVQEGKPNVRKWLLEEVQKSEAELATTIVAFQKANVNAMIVIEKANRKELLGGEETVLKNRKQKEKENLVSMSSNLTNQLLSISRVLADTSQRSSDTLGTLANSSTIVNSTREELENMGVVLAQSGKLLTKYGRREKTDKVLVFFAFAFFIACVFYVIQKRLF